MYARREHNLLIGERMAEAAKIAAGSAYPLDEEKQVTLRGRDLVTGLPKAVEVSQRRDCARPSPARSSLIIEVVKLALEETPPELVADIMQNGITLAGGGALLAGLDRRLHRDQDAGADRGRPVDLRGARHRAHRQVVGAVFPRPGWKRRNSPRGADLARRAWRIGRRVRPARRRRCPVSRPPLIAESSPMKAATARRIIPPVAHADACSPRVCCSRWR